MKLIDDNTVPVLKDHKEESVQRFLDRKKRKPPKVSDDNDDTLLVLARFSEATGSVSDDFRTLLLRQISSLLPSDTDREVFLNAALAVLHGLKPQDEMEGLLGVQLFSLHSLAMEMMKRAAASNDPKWTDANVNRVDKLLRAFRETLAALQKFQGKGSQQQVRVEHVHVHQGGQAVVGAVNN